MSKILLTGGAGYIGSHTAIEMLNAGYEIIVADNFSNSSKESLRRVEKITGKTIPFYQADINDKVQTEKIFEEIDIAAVIHFAGLKSVGESVSCPVRYYKNNLLSSLNLLEVMEKHHVKKLVFSSSATVYGNPDHVPFDETMPVGVCTNPYGWTKQMSEQIFQDACVADKDLTVILLRYFNPVGAHESGTIGEAPNGTPNNLMPYISQVAVGTLKQLSVYGSDYPTHDGTGVRDYIHVVDLAKGHLAAIRYAETHTGTEIFNLGTGCGYSVLDMVKAFEKVNGVSVPYRIADRRPGDIASAYADPAKARDILGWQAEKTLEDMCRDTWKWQRQNPNGYNA